MATLPQLLAEDVQQLDEVLRELLMQCDGTTALLADKGGFLIAHQGHVRDFDLTTIAALASGAYLANQTIANLVHETQFDSVYQQGERYSLFTRNVDEYCLLIVIFRAQRSVGAVKYFAAGACAHIAEQMEVARLRNPEGGVDLAELNLADPGDIFRRKS
jgi:predicted regulator of Ras-like GTPase activity (Roadblock/LC7/MglB family)